MEKKPSIIIITGQTATGKTKLALEYAQKYRGELINCDSRQIYKYLDIITGKDINKNSKLKSPTSPAGRQKSKTNQFFKIKKLNHFDIGYYLLGGGTSAVEEESRNQGRDKLRDGKTAEVRLWLYDVVAPPQYFSSFDYKRCALWVIKKTLTENKTPIIVGGTYLYLRHLLYGVETENIPPDWDLRKELGNKSAKQLLKIYENLRKKSTYLPAFLSGRLSNSERNNPQRLIRKIEIIMNSTKYHIDTDRSTMVFSLPEKLGSTNIGFEFFGLKFKDSESLRKAIEKRVEERLKQGAIDEVKGLLKMGYTEQDPGLKTIGYRQLILHLKGAIDIDTAIREWTTKEVQYAKRQYTFMKKDPHIKWINV